MNRKDPNIDSLFDQALKIESAKSREDFLRQQCGQDAALREQVESLLAAHNQMESQFLDATTDTASSSKNPRAGTLIGPYKLLQQIGEGGFGVVWMADQLKPVKRRVALKIIKLGMDTKQVIARFEAERQALAMMDHPHIAKVLDAGTTDNGRPYFVMEYIRGIPILEYCDSGKHDTQTRLDLFVSVCQAIQHAHQKGIIHRDIKPTNVLVTMHDGVPVPKVIDFGIAKATNSELTQKTLFTEHQQVIGTPAYMSPEQAEMSGLDIDTRSDIYSLGVLLYELLTGTTPFENDSLLQGGFREMMRIIREEEPPRPSARLSSLGATATTTAQQRGSDINKLRSLLTGDIDWIVMKALEKDRTRRYETANGLAMDIQRYMNSEPIVARPPSTWYRLRKAWGRNRIAYTSAAAIAAVILLCGSFAIWQAVQATVAKNIALKAEAEKESQREQAELARKDAERNREQAEMQRYAADIGLADASIRESNLVRARLLLEGLRNDGILDDSPAFEWRYLIDQAKGDHRSAIPLNGKSVFLLATSPKNSILACGEFGGDIQIMDLQQNQTIAKVVGAGQYNGIQFSTDGTKLMLWSFVERRLTMIDAQSGLMHSQISDIIGPPSPDGRYIVRRQPESKPRIYDLVADQELNTIDVSANCMQVVQMGKWLLAGDKWEKWSIHGARVIDLTGNNTPIELPEVIGPSTPFSADRRELAYGDTTGNLHILDLETGQSRLSNALFDKKRKHVNALTISSDGSLLAAATWEPVLAVCDLESGDWWRLGRLESEVYVMAFAPDGRTLVTGDKDGVVRMWNIEKPVEQTPALVLPTPVPQRKVPVSDDGSMFALSIASETGDTKQIRVYDTIDFSLKVPIDTPGIALTFLDDDRQLVSMDRTGLNYWNLLSRQREKRIDWSPLQQDVTLGKSIVSNDRQFVVIPNGNEQIRIHDLRDGRLAHTIDNLQMPGTKALSGGVALSRDNQLLAVANGVRNIDLFDLASGRRMMSLGGHRQHLHSIEFNEDASGLIAGSHGDLLYWDLSSGRYTELRGHRNNTIKAVAVSNDGCTAASLGHNFIKLWSTSTKRELNTIPWPEESAMASLQFAAEDTVLIAHEHTMYGPKQSRIRIWRATAKPSLPTNLD